MCNPFFTPHSNHRNVANIKTILCVCVCVCVYVCVCVCVCFVWGFWGGGMLPSLVMLLKIHIPSTMDSNPLYLF